MKSTAGFVLGLIGGIGSALLGIWGLFAASIFATIPGLGLLSGLGIILPIIILIGAGLAIWGALLMNKEDNAKVKKGGILTLIGGIIGSVNILSIIGGIIGLVSAGKESTPASTATTPAKEVTPNKAQATKV